MTSFNHYALGSVANFFHSVIGGISPLEPGWRKIKIAPQPGGTVTTAKVSHLTPSGLVSCEWKLDGVKLQIHAVVPPNTTAQVELPGVNETVGSGKHTWNVKYKPETEWPPALPEPRFGRKVEVENTLAE